MHDPNKGIRARRPGTFASLPSPCIDLHMSRPANHPGNGLTVSSHSSCKNRRKECPPAPQKGRERPEGAVFCALRNLALPTQVLVGASNAQHLMRISSRHRHPAGREEVWRRAKIVCQKSSRLRHFFRNFFIWAIFDYDRPYDQQQFPHAGTSCCHFCFST